jgi:hypothetical protein
VDVTAMGERPTELSLRLEVASEYVLGLPFFVEVTLSNETEGAEYYDLLPCDPFSAPFPIEFTFSADENAVTLPALSGAAREAKKRGFDLSPGEARTFVLDLSDLNPELSPGTWQCQARWVMRHEMPRSAPVRVVLAGPPAADQPLLERLRSGGRPQAPSWANLVEFSDALKEDVFRALSDRAKATLVPYLIMRQAVYGPEPLASFPTDYLAQHQRGPWSSEASVLLYELQWAREAPDLVPHRQALLQRWPGLAFRVQRIESGAGLLTTLRREYGADSGSA